MKPRRRKSVKEPIDPDFTEEANVSHIDVEEPEEEEHMDSNSKGQAKVTQLKKIKLPPIKKNKPQGTGTSDATPTPTSTTPATKPRLPLDIISAGGSKQSEIRKAQLGASDLDLSNKSIYQELFKTVGVPFSGCDSLPHVLQSLDGGAPRTGLNRRAKEEERRKELNKMKEEYLAKRASEVHSLIFPINNSLIRGRNIPSICKLDPKR